MDPVYYEVEIDLPSFIDESVGAVVTYIVDNYDALVREELNDNDELGLDDVKEYIKKGDNPNIKEELINVFFANYKREILEKLFANV